MDTSTVQEIANQLGIGVDQILQYLPAYAETQILGNWISIISCLVILIFFMITGIVSFKLYNRYKDERGFISLKTDIFNAICIVSFLSSAVTLIVLLILLSVSIPNIISWNVAPELTFLKSLIPS